MFFRDRAHSYGPDWRPDPLTLRWCHPSFPFIYISNEDMPQELRPDFMLLG